MEARPKIRLKEDGNGSEGVGWDSFRGGAPAKNVIDQR